MCAASYDLIVHRTLTKQAQNTLAAAQTKMEISILNIKCKDRNTNISVRERTTVIYMISNARKMKWSWAGHTNRLKDDRWTLRVTTWRPYDKEKTTRETSQAAERRPGQMLERHDLAEDSTRHANLETACCCWPTKLKSNRLLIVLTSSRFLVLVAMTLILENPRSQSTLVRCG